MCGGVDLLRVVGGGTRGAVRGAAGLVGPPCCSRAAATPEVGGVGARVVGTDAPNRPGVGGWGRGGTGGGHWCPEPGWCRRLRAWVHVVWALMPPTCLVSEVGGMGARGVGIGAPNLAALPGRVAQRWQRGSRVRVPAPASSSARSEEHTSELQSLMRISYAVFC